MTGTLDTAAWESELAGDSPEALKAMKNGIEQTKRLGFEPTNDRG